MAIGSKFWARSYIISSGKKIYLDEFIWNVEEKLNSRKEFESFNVARWVASTGATKITVKVSSITEYGKL